ncbi:protein FAF-like, chloroplastic [Phragmites australis]|uniref:protein FAF-like, chloroplastic n=1 Tax=Phragmites australis TaxID=29695 RepID=UPI002D76B924|nr:protein FAF-like, chloroplastic [Phragmites australis]
MALTVFETTEQLHPCHLVEQGGDGGNVAGAGAEKAAVMLKETDHGGDDHRPERDDIWNMIQAQKPPAAPRQAQAPYVHPLVRRSSSLLTQKSLEICTESLGSETGSDGFSDADGATDLSCPNSDDEREEGEDEVAARAPPPRAFPPPLPSLARRTVGAMQMRQTRRDGRLVVEAVPMPSPTLFRAQRRGGRLLLSFADTAAPASDELDKDRGQLEPEQQADEHGAHEEDEDEEEEVEVVDRGTVVEVKVSTQPQAHSGSGPRVHRSALVINKFVGAEPVATCEEINDAAPAAPQHPPKPPRRCTGSTTTAVAALAAASALSATAAPRGNGDDSVPGATCGENKLLMTARRRRSKEELLKHMRRCGQLSGRQLFIWEGCIATSS